MKNTNNSKNIYLRKHSKPVLILMGFLLLGALGCEKKDRAGDDGKKYAVDKEFARGPLTVHVMIDKDKISIADTLRVRLEATIDQGYEVTMPAVREFLQEEQRFGILDYEELPNKLGKDNQTVVQREYRLEPLLSGEYAIPGLKFVFRKKDKVEEGNEQTQTTAAKDTEAKSQGQEEEGKQYELMTDEIPVEVTSLLDEDRAGLTIKDIKSVVGPQSKKTWWWVWVLSGLVVAAGGAAVGIVLWRRRKVKPLRILKAAHELAYERLRKLAEEDLIKQGKIKEFYEGISNILRWYIEHRFDLKAPERTTEEFLNEVKATEVLSNEQKEMLREFLTHCDLVKFARYGPTKAEIQQTFDLTRKFIEATRITEKQVDVTEQVRQAQSEMARSA